MIIGPLPKVCVRLCGYLDCLCSYLAVKRAARPLHFFSVHDYPPLSVFVNSILYGRGFVNTAGKAIPKRYGGHYAFLRYLQLGHAGVYTGDEIHLEYPLLKALTGQRYYAVLVGKAILLIDKSRIAYKYHVICTVIKLAL